LEKRKQAELKNPITSIAHVQKITKGRGDKIKLKTKIKLKK
jgi:hypothetical protein